MDSKRALSPLSTEVVSNPSASKQVGWNAWFTGVRQIDQRSARRAAFTLLELLLALALTSIILVAVGMALDLHLRSYTKRRAIIEQSQLARALLNRIAEDIRATIRYEEPDLSSYNSIMGNVSAESLAGIDPSALSAEAGSSEATAALESMGMEGESVDSLLAEATNPNTQDLASSTTLPTMPGIYGNQYELQIDVSRLPSQEQYQMAAPLDGTLVPFSDLPSDIKTITYYLQAPGAATALSPSAETEGIVPGSSPFDPLEAQPTGGLVRRELDRSITQWALTNGNVAGLERAGTIIAPEAVSLEFRYFDGTQWLTQWDTSTLMSLPIAIEVLLALQPPADASALSTMRAASPAGSVAEEGWNYYRMVVHLPTGGMPATTSSSSSTEDAAETDASTSGGTP